MGEMAGRKKRHGSTLGGAIRTLAGEEGRDGERERKGRVKGRRRR